MLKLFKKKPKLSDTVMNIIVKDYTIPIKSDLYKPTYEQIKEDFMRAKKYNVYKLRYELACIDTNIKDKLTLEGYIISESIEFGLPYFTVTHKFTK